MDIWPDAEFHEKIARADNRASGLWGQAMGAVKFDPTVNLGHVITACVFLVTAAGAWTTLDSRQTRLEERTIRLETARERDDRDTLVATAALARMTAQVESIQASTRRIEGLLDRSPQNGGR